MTTDACQAMRLELGAYLLGALDAAERARVADHLELCARCRDDLAGLAPLPGLLARIPSDELAGRAPTGPGAAEQLLAQIARIRRRRRRIAASVATACAVVAVGIFAATATLGGTTGSPAIVVAAANPTSHVSGRATLVATPEGSTVEVGVIGVHPGIRCQLVVVGRDGRREIAATWQANYDGPATVIGASAMSPGQIRELAVVATTGAPLLVFAPRAPGAAASTPT